MTILVFLKPLFLLSLSIALCSAVPIGEKEELSFPTSTPSSNSFVSCPSVIPSSTPSSTPSTSPTVSPTGCPSTSPTGFPTSQPTGSPSGQPTLQPSASPSGSLSPTENQTLSPTSPSGSPSAQPTGSPSGQPTSSPSGQPTLQPSASPSGSLSPTENQTLSPTESPSFSLKPTRSPSTCPSLSSSPTSPSGSPSGQPTSSPSGQPTSSPSGQPTLQPSQPSCLPTTTPSGTPTVVPSSMPSGKPSIFVTFSPTDSPTDRPTANPTAVPTNLPTPHPTPRPTRLPTPHPKAGTTWWYATQAYVSVKWSPDDEATILAADASDMVTALDMSFYAVLRDLLGSKSGDIVTEVVKESQDIFDLDRMRQLRNEPERSFVDSFYAFFSESLQRRRILNPSWDSFTLGVWSTGDNSLYEVSEALEFVMTNQTILIEELVAVSGLESVTEFLIHEVRSGITSLPPPGTTQANGQPSSIALIIVWTIIAFLIGVLTISYVKSRCSCCANKNDPFTYNAPSESLLHRMTRRSKKSGRDSFGLIGDMEMSNRSEDDGSAY